MSAVEGADTTPAAWICSECGRLAYWDFIGSPQDNVGMWLSQCCIAPSNNGEAK